MFKIEQKVPMPPPQRRQPTKYPWKLMKPGESFFVPKGNTASMRSVASRASSEYNMLFTARAVDGGVRVWRVK